MSKRKLVQSDDSNPNHEFCEILNELSTYERTVANNTFKANAYKKASIAISKHPTKLTNGEDAMKLPGVGKIIGLKLDEFIKTGTLEKLDKIKKDDNSQSITELTRVSGIGPANARKLVTEHNITSIEDLRKKTSLLNHHQKIGLQHLEDFEERIPRSEMDQWNSILLENIKKVDDSFTAQICGSYRRGAETCGDIDVLLTHPDCKTNSKKTNESLLIKIVRSLESEGLITDTLALGESKFAGVCRLKKSTSKGDKESKFRRLDLRLIPTNQFHFALLYFTGSDLFNKNMRAHALDKGFTLNEYCIKPLGSTGVPGSPIPVESEKDIFDIIDYPYKTPKERTS